MKKEYKNFALIVGLAIIMTCAFITIGPAPALAGPVEVVMNGSYLPDQDKGGKDIYGLWVRGKKYFVKFDKVEIFKSDRYSTGKDILRTIDPPRVTLVGSDDAMKLLGKSGHEGKSFSLKGTFYIGDQVLMIHSEKDITIK